MTNWVQNDYEPTPGEIEEFRAYIAASGTDEERGLVPHGRVTFAPSMEQYLPDVPGLVLFDRTVRDDGKIEYQWRRP